MNLEFESFNTTSGLSQNFVTSIAQDKEGFLWIGTDDGLNRFDGYEFKVFKNNEKSKNTIVDNSIRAICVAPDSSIWIGSNNGVCRYFPKTETFQQFPIDYTDSTKLSGASVSDIKIHPDGSIWISYVGDGINVIRPGRAKIMHYTINGPVPYRLKSDLVSNLLFMPNGDVMVGTLEGLEIIDKNGLVLEDDQVLAKYPWKDSIHHTIRSMIYSKDRRTLWIGTELQGLYKVDLIDQTVRNFNKNNSGLDFNPIISIYEDSRGLLWIGSEAIYLFDKKEQELVLYNEYGIQGSIVIRNPIYSIFEDKDKNIWMGTFRLGLLKYNPMDTRILHYHTDQGEGSIKNNEILSFNQDNAGNIWVGTGGAGLYRLNEDLKGFEEALLNESFSSPSIKVIHKDNKGNLWLGTWEGGLMRYHPQKNDLEIFSPKEKNFPSWHVWDIKEDKAGNFWLGTLRDGLIYFNPITKSYITYKYNPDDTTGIPNDEVLSLHIDRQENVWVGTGNGLSIRKKGSNRFINLMSDQPNSITSNIILCMYEDRQGRVWAGTNGGGINIIDKNLSVIRVLSQKDGLPSGTVAALQPDDHDNIWASTYNGLVRIDGKTLTITEVPQIIGLQGREFIPRSSYKSKDGKLFFGGVNGFNLFHPDSLVFNPLHETVVFTSLKILNEEISPNSPYDGRTILTKSISEADEIILSYKDYSFTLNFAPLTYNWQNSLHYSYYLENFDKAWQYTTAERRFIHYTNLSPGDYVLKIKASFDGKTWPGEARTLRIKVISPWWATWWFKTLTAAFVIVSLYSLYIIRVRFLKKQQSKLENLVSLKTNELTKSNSEITALLGQVAEQRDSIEHKNHELQQINEELEAQRDSLALKSDQLEKAQNKLQEVNEDLEKLVSERTKKLNDTVHELETFLYRASHDIRGPISSMLGLIEVTRIEPDHEKFYRVYNEFLHKTVIQLDRTLQKLLEKHIIEKNDVVYERIDKDTFLKILHDLVRNISYFRPEYFNVSIADGTVVRTDRMMLSILLGNLLENAFFFSTGSENKHVNLDVKHNGHDTVIMVKDHGPGIDMNLKDKIFEMFYRGNILSSGNGLGLYLVKCALSKINGSIDLDTKEGSYSRFIITIPD
jgi:ligand-binding sensor domain-containing protein/signal transduction histidine kinase